MKHSKPEGMGGLLGVSDVDLDRVADAIEAAQCPHREGPFGGYDYGYNEAFYGPAPKDGRHVVRDFRDPASPNYGAWVHQSHSPVEHDQAFRDFTRRHIALAAITAWNTRTSSPDSGDFRG